MSSSMIPPLQFMWGGNCLPSQMMMLSMVWSKARLSAQLGSRKIRIQELVERSCQSLSIAISNAEVRSAKSISRKTIMLDSGWPRCSKPGRVGRHTTTEPTSGVPSLCCSARRSRSGWFPSTGRGCGRSPKMGIKSACWIMFWIWAGMSASGGKVLHWSMPFSHAASPKDVAELPVEDKCRGKCPAKKVLPFKKGPLPPSI